MKLNTSTVIPLEAQYLYKRGREMMDQQKEDQALGYLRQAVFIAPTFSRAYRDLGTCLSRLGHAGEAMACYQKAYRIDPGQPDPARKNEAVRGHIDGNPVPGYGLNCLLW